jgi:hypothetical protein
LKLVPFNSFFKNGANVEENLKNALQGKIFLSTYLIKNKKEEIVC